MDRALPSPDWGLCPYFGPVPAYSLFVTLGLLAGLAIFFWLTHKDSRLDDHLPAVLIGAIVGGVLGAKLPYWLSGQGMATLFAGRTVVGGVIGGTIGVIVARRLIGLKEPTGNTFAPALALGFAIGRLGCLCRGCCYGIETHQGWGIDLGDHLLRWPTQAIESLFGLLLSAYLMLALRKNPLPGVLFRHFIFAFFTFRFLIEFVRDSSTFLWHLSEAQWVSVITIMVYSIDYIKKSYGVTMEASTHE